MYVASLFFVQLLQSFDEIKERPEFVKAKVPVVFCEKRDSQPLLNAHLVLVALQVSQLLHVLHHR